MIDVLDRTDKIVLFRDDDTLLDLITFSVQSSFNFEIVNKGIVLKDDLPSLINDEVKLIICDYYIEGEGLVGLMVYLRENKINIPVFVTDDINDTSKEIFQEDDVYENINKEKTLDEINQKIEKYFKIDEHSPVAEYCKIAARTLVRFEGIEDDIYILLKSKRFLKLFTKKDKITEDDVERYAKKGVYDLYLNKQVARWILKEINKNFAEAYEALSDDKPMVLDPLVKEEILNEEKISSDEELPEPFSFDKELVEELNQTIIKTVLKVKKNPSLGNMLRKLKVNRDKKSYFNSHIGLLCNITTGVAKGLDWASETTLEKLVCVSYMHDITMVDHGHLAEIMNMQEFEERKDQLSEEEQSVFLNHPNDVVELVHTIPNVSADIETIIVQHHELPDGSGFPNKIDAQRLSPLAALFIVSHDFVDYIMRNPKWLLAEYIIKAKKRFPGSKFRKILQVIESLKKV